MEPAYNYNQAVFVNSSIFNWSISNKYLDYLDWQQRSYKDINTEIFSFYQIREKIALSRLPL